MQIFDKVDSDLHNTEERQQEKESHAETMSCVNQENKFLITAEIK